MNRLLLDVKFQQTPDEIQKPNHIGIINGDIVKPRFNQSDVVNSYITINSDEEKYLLDLNYVQVKKFIFEITPYVPPIFLAVSISTQNVIYSDDGIVWNTIDLSSQFTQFSDCIFSTYDNLFYIVGQGGGAKLSYVDNPEDISNYTSINFASSQLNDIDYNNSGIFVTVPSSTNGFYTTSPPSGWLSTNPFPGGINQGLGITFANNIWMLSGFGFGGNSLASSNDGITYSALGNPHGGFPNISNKTAYSFSLNRWVSGGAGTNPLCFSDDNGTSWTTTTGTTIFTNCQDVIFAQNKFVAVGQGNFKIAYSNDGITWTGVPASTTFFLNGGLQIGRNIAFSQKLNLFVAVGDGSTNPIATSSDGINWNCPNNNPFGGNGGIGVCSSA